MKLQVVRAGAGLRWVGLGIRVFFRQPLALAALFFLLMLAVSAVSLIPALGNLLALTLMPGATLGLMAAARESSSGRFPFPTILLVAFRAGRGPLRAMLILGVLYALSFLLVLGISALIDGGKFAALYLVGGGINADLLADNRFLAAAASASVLYVPVSMLFWHAPALVHWYGLPPAKSIFFSLVACLRNFRAFAVYSLAWMAMVMAISVTLASVTAMMGNPQMLVSAILPITMIVAAMFFTSIYFTFRDCFEEPPKDPP
jgi:hypothetical protein